MTQGATSLQCAELAAADAQVADARERQHSAAPGTRAGRGTERPLARGTNASARGVVIV
jgi:hypothetical protein